MKEAINNGHIYGVKKQETNDELNQPFPKTSITVHDKQESFDVPVVFIHSQVQILLKIHWKDRFAGVFGCPSTIKPKLLGWALVIFFSTSKETRSIYFCRVFWHIGSKLVFFRTNGLSTKLYSRFSKITQPTENIFRLLVHLGYGNIACSLVFDFLYSSSQESL